MVDMRSVSPEEGALLDVTQRLTRQIEQQLTQLRRIRDRARTERPGADAALGDLEHVARRMQRDTERLGLLCGATPPAAGARSVADALGDAAAATVEPVRVTVRPAPIATIAAGAAVELVHVLAEVLDGALAESSLGVTIGGRLGPAGLTVDVTLDGRLREPGFAIGRVAEALARRSANGIQVHRSGSGPYAIVLCPAAAVTVPVQRRPDPLNDPLPADPPLRPRAPLGTDLFGVRSTTAGGSALFGPASGPRRNGAAGPPDVHRFGNGQPPGDGPVAPRADYLPSGVEALFGPLPVRGRDEVATPIYEAVASAWFREDDGTGRAADWESAGDAEWRAAAARAAHAEDSAGTTASGLPRRRPGTQMVTPPLQRTRSAQTRERGRTAEERAPERIRERLEGYQRGLRQGRHRAAEPDPPAGRATRWA